MSLKKYINTYLFFGFIIPIVLLFIFTIAWGSIREVDFTKSKLLQFSKIISNQIELILNSNTLLIDDQYDVDKYSISKFENYLKGTTYPGNAKGVYLLNDKGLVLEYSGMIPALNSYAETDYFKEALKKGVSFSQVIQIKLNNYFIVVNLLKVSISDEKRLLLRVYNLDSIRKLSSSIDLNNGSYGYLVDLNGYIIAHPDLSRIGTITENLVLKEILSGLRLGSSMLSQAYEYNYRGTDKFMAFQRLINTPWLLIITDTKQNTIESFTGMQIWIITILIIIIVVIFLFMSRLNYKIYRPLAILNKGVVDLGNMVFEVTSFHNNDEIGRIGESLNVTTSRIEESFTSQKKELTESAKKLYHYSEVIEKNSICVFDWNIESDELELSENATEVFGPDSLRLKTMNEFLQQFFSADTRIQFKHAFTGLKNNLTKEVKLSLQVVRLAAHQPMVLVRARKSETNNLQILGIFVDLTTKAF